MGPGYIMNGEEVWVLIGPIRIQSADAWRKLKGKQRDEDQWM